MITSDRSLGIIPFLFLITLVFSCSRKSSLSGDNRSGDAMSETVQDTLTTTPQALPDTVIWYSRSGCFGNCPVFSFLLFDNREAIYSGRAHVDNIGTFSFTLEEGDHSKFLEVIQNASLEQFQTSYPVNGSEWVVDLPTVTIVYFDTDSTKKVIKVNHSPPESLKNFIDTLEEKINSIDWMGF